MGMCLPGYENCTAGRYGTVSTVRTVDGSRNNDDPGNIVGEAGLTLVLFIFCCG